MILIPLGLRKASINTTILCLLCPLWQARQGARSNTRYVAYLSPLCPELYGQFVFNINVQTVFIFRIIKVMDTMVEDHYTCTIRINIKTLSLSLSQSD